MTQKIIHLFNLTNTFYDLYRHIYKIIILEKLFRKNKTSTLLKTPEKDFHFLGTVSLMYEFINRSLETCCKQVLLFYVFSSFPQCLSFFFLSFFLSFIVIFKMSFFLSFIVIRYKVYEKNSTLELG